MKRNRAKTVIAQREVIVEQRRRQDTETGFTTVPDGTLRGICELRVDVVALTQMLGTKALRSKHNRSRLASGCIEVVVRPRTKVRRDVDGNVRE